ncbi:uncharacterized protein GVI51_J07205 [Nakaseomyces glabratus]|uniref:Uncharacterized protein n=1 Tax=Candida glabrata (strain ATCC 2001 / BCRC 20586 / JCM 3761 / NBRC 0622 / NRRL Y-65 / CBS 138) TaxID=284593 RepID=Q6FP18_CANGA|nr:uncharacterized protein CAGL0J07348g [Nakaseomyces glabratus]KAH7598445.1 Septation initiation [Nakaseomyces glabratus]KAH7603874.1 Septation initiation [Nakaseomyces glabratus]QHS67680.1 uncharacterized protein GVI51_J07205 [Nakaseomyces glabratus]CAG60977.1 unnamed protein product [Nakaseomyces glabratus]|eukprot:XP_448026.1 uncharacterized protein CAGL0J07348g [[Candida] glabrata]
MSLSVEDQRAEHMRKEAALVALQYAYDEEDKENHPLRETNGHFLNHPKTTIPHSTPLVKIDDFNSKYEKEIETLKDQLFSIKNLLGIEDPDSEHSDYELIETSIKKMKGQIENALKENRMLKDQAVENASVTSSRISELETKMNELTAQNQTQNELIQSLKKDNQLKEEELQQSSKAAEQLTLELDTSKEEIKNLTNERMSNREYIKTFILFGRPIGEIITDCLDSSINVLDDSIKKTHADIVSFKTNQDINYTSIQSKAVERLDEIKAILSQLPQQIKDNENLNSEKLNELVSKYNEQNLETIEKVNKTNKISTGINNETLNLITQVNELKSEIQQLHSEVEQINNQQFNLQEILQEKEQLQKTVFELQLQLNTERESKMELQQLNDSKDNKLLSITGNTNNMLSFEKLKQLDNSFCKEEYVSLKISEIEDISLVQLQNMAKMICMYFRTPFDKLDIKLPLAAIQIIHERKILIHFANILNEYFMSKPLSMKKCTDSAYCEWQLSHNIFRIEHPLKFKLEELYTTILRST